MCEHHTYTLNKCCPYNNYNSQVTMVRHAGKKPENSSISHHLETVNSLAKYTLPYLEISVGASAGLLTNLWTHKVVLEKL